MGLRPTLQAKQAPTGTRSSPRAMLKGLVCAAGAGTTVTSPDGGGIFYVAGLGCLARSSPHHWTVGGYAPVQPHSGVSFLCLEGGSPECTARGTSVVPTAANLSFVHEVSAASHVGARGIVHAGDQYWRFCPVLSINTAQRARRLQEWALTRQHHRIAGAHVAMRWLKLGLSGTGSLLCFALRPCNVAGGRCWWETGWGPPWF